MLAFLNVTNMLKKKLKMANILSSLGQQFVLILGSKSKIRRTSRVRKSGKRPCTACASVRRQLGASEA